MIKPYPSIIGEEAYAFMPLPLTFLFYDCTTGSTCLLRSTGLPDQLGTPFFQLCTLLLFLFPIPFFIDLLQPSWDRQRQRFALRIWPGTIQVSRSKEMPSCGLLG